MNRAVDRWYCTANILYRVFDKVDTVSLYFGVECDCMVHCIVELTKLTRFHCIVELTEVKKHNCAVDRFDNCCIVQCIVELTKLTNVTKLTQFHCIVQLQCIVELTKVKTPVRPNSYLCLPPSCPKTNKLFSISI